MLGRSRMRKKENSNETKNLYRKLVDSWYSFEQNFTSDMAFSFRIFCRAAASSTSPALEAHDRPLLRTLRPFSDGVSKDETDLRNGTSLFVTSEPKECVKVRETRRYGSSDSMTFTKYCPCWITPGTTTTVTVAIPVIKATMYRNAMTLRGSLSFSGKFRNLCSRSCPNCAASTARFPKNVSTKVPTATAYKDRRSTMHVAKATQTIRRFVS
mmetsp:Transcript_53939/g.73706  ORF Transcript_53939/g.73706 Transcript_53939/m.73706 type:complete len:212 (+) Transcript_53939:616-1251(+)